MLTVVVRHVSRTRASKLGRTVIVWAAALLIWQASTRLVATEGMTCADFTRANWEGSSAGTRVSRDPAAPLLGSPFAATHEQFSARCDGWLYVETPGKTTFVLVSDDASDLAIDDQRVVDDGGRHGLTPAAAVVTLMPGSHRMSVRYSQEGGGASFAFVWGAEGALASLNRTDVARQPLSRIEHQLRPYARIARILALLIALVITIGTWRSELRPIAQSVGRRMLRANEETVSAPRRALSVLLIVAIASRVMIALTTHAILWPDSDSYYLAARGMLGGNWLNHEVFRTPGYSWFLAAFLSGGESPFAGSAIIAAQRLLGVLATLMVYGIGRRAFTPTIAFYAALAWTIAPLQLYYESVVGSEALFVVLFLAAVWAVVRAVETARLSWFVLAGLLCGGAVLTRPVARGLVVVITMAVAWHARRRPRLIIKALAAVAVYLLCVTPWMYANSRAYGFFGIARGEGLGMFMRAFDRERLGPPQHTGFPEVDRAYRWFSNEYPYVHYRVRDELNYYRGFNAAGADAAMAGYAQEAIAAHPIAYATGIAVDWIALFVAPHRSVDVCHGPAGPVLCAARNANATLPAFPADAPSGLVTLRTVVTSYIDRAYDVMPLVAVFAFAGAVLCLRRSAPEMATFVQILLLMTIVYFTLVSVGFNTIEDRYRLPVDSFIVLFAVHAIATAISEWPLHRLRAARLWRVPAAA